MIKSTVVHFGIFQTNLDFKDGALYRLSNLVTRETPFQFQYQALVPAPMSLARNYACSLILGRNSDQVEMTFGPGSMPLFIFYKLLQVHRADRDLAHGHKTKIKEIVVLENVLSAPWKKIIWYSLRKIAFLLGGAAPTL